MDLPQVEQVLVESRLRELAERAKAASRPATPAGGGIYGPGGYGPGGYGPGGYGPGPMGPGGMGPGGMPPMGPGAGRGGS